MIMVASYCRVSTDKEDQANSFEAQQRYFKEYIDRQPDWELYAVYADEGITGTSTKKRTQFNQMINDARLGKFRLIITKEVSRFSRNILDTISYTRELKSLGVGVLFMNDGISTLEPDAELRLSIMGSIAQEESRKTSSRVKWGQTRQMERGVVFGRSMLGYDVKDGKMTINPEGAEVVRLIFHMYGVEKKGTSVIARELRERGICSYSGNPRWSGSHIVKILRNEKYVGDLVQKKTYTPDYLTHAKRYNHGEEPMVALTDHHEPIIDRELWDIVQMELRKRNCRGELSSGHSNRYIFSGKIKCGLCGASFVSRKKKRKDGTVYKRWGCYTATMEGRRHIDSQGNEVGCNIGRMVREELALDMLKQAVAALDLDRKWIADNVTALATEAILAGERGSMDSADKLTHEMEQLTKKKEADDERTIRQAAGRPPSSPERGAGKGEAALRHRPTCRGRAAAGQRYSQRRDRQRGVLQKYSGPNGRLSGLPRGSAAQSAAHEMGLRPGAFVPAERPNPGRKHPENPWVQYRRRCIRRWGVRKKS